MGEFVIHLADVFGLESPHVIGPNVGTGASLFAAALYPGRFRSLIVGGGPAAFPLRLGGVLKDWVEAPDLDGYRRADPREIVAGVMTDIQRYALLDFVREDYLSSYQGDRFVESMRYVRSYPDQLRAPCASGYPRSTRRCRSSPGRETRWCQRSTPNFSISGCPPASSTS